MEQDLEEPEVEVTEPEAQVNTQEYNWKQAQEVMSHQKREIEALRDQMNQFAKPAVAQEEPDEFESADPEDYITLGKAREMASREAKKQAKKIIEEYSQKQNIANDEVRARGKYEDYDYVIDNYALGLIKNDPALAYQVQNSRNPAETAYRLGKMTDGYQESMNKQTSPRAEKILKNSSRPVSSHSGQSSLKSQADAFSNMSKEQVWAEAQRYASQA